jgi:ABC-2 type transport system permease protein
VSAAAVDVVRLDAASGTRAPGFGATLRSEWIKFWSVRSTPWATAMLFVVGAGLTALICAAAAGDLADGSAGESPGSFVTWGMMIAQVMAVVLGAMAVTSEYSTGLVRATLAATPRRGAVLAAKALVVAGTLFVVGTVTAVVGYLAGNWFLDRQGVGLALSDDGVLRSLLGSGLYLAGLGLLAAGVGLLVRHTAAALSIVLGTVFVLGTMANLLPGAWGDWVTKLMPGNAGSVVSQPVPFDPNLLSPWVGFAVFAAETAVVLAFGYASFRRRDA